MMLWSHVVYPIHYDFLKNPLQALHGAVTISYQKVVMATTTGTLNRELIGIAIALDPFYIVFEPLEGIVDACLDTGNV